MPVKQTRKNKKSPKNLMKEATLKGKINGMAGVPKAYGLKTKYGITYVTAYNAAALKRGGTRRR